MNCQTFVPSSRWQDALQVCSANDKTQGFRALSELYPTWRTGKNDNNARPALLSQQRASRTSSLTLTAGKRTSRASSRVAALQASGGALGAFQLFRAHIASRVAPCAQPTCQAFGPQRMSGCTWTPKGSSRAPILRLRCCDGMTLGCCQPTSMCEHKRIGRVMLTSGLQLMYG